MRISDWSSDVCSSDLIIDLASLPGPLTGTAQAIQNGKPKQWAVTQTGVPVLQVDDRQALIVIRPSEPQQGAAEEFATGGDLHLDAVAVILPHANRRDRKSTRLNSSH